MVTVSDPDRHADSTTVAKGAAINLFGILARASRVLFTLFVTRVAGPRVFGLFTLAVAVVEVTTRFTIFGMDKTLLKFVPEVRDADDPAVYRILATVFRIGLLLALFATLTVAVFAPWISDELLHKPELRRPLRLIALSFVPLTLLNLILSATKALKIMAYDAIVTGMVLPIFLLLFSLPILWFADATAILTLAYTGTTCVALVVAAGLFRTHFSLTRALSTPANGTFSRVVRFSTPLGLHDFIQYLGIKLELFILAFFVSPLELGIYALAVELAFVIRKFRQIFDPILIPVMSEAQGNQQLDRVRGNMTRVIRWMLVLGVFYVGAMSLFAEPVLSIFGDDFARGAVALVVLCVAHLIAASTGLLDMAMMVSGRPRINLLNVCIVLVAQTTLNLLLVPRFGLVGAAGAALGSFTLIAAIRLGQSLMILRLNPFAWNQLKPILAGVVAGLAVLAIRGGLRSLGVSVTWLVLLLVFALLYGLVLRIVGLEGEDRRLIGVLLRSSRSSPPGE